MKINLSAHAQHCAPPHCAMRGTALLSPHAACAHACGARRRCAPRTRKGVTQQMASAADEPAREQHGRHQAPRKRSSENGRAEAGAAANAARRWAGSAAHIATGELPGYGGVRGISRGWIMNGWCGGHQRQALATGLPCSGTRLMSDGCTRASTRVNVRIIVVIDMRNGKHIV